MSLLGKILAVFNVLGAICLFLLAVLDYSTRQAWSYSVMRHELIIRGMPLDDVERDEQGRPLVDALTAKTITDHFSTVGGNGVSTQVEEVARLKAAFDAKLNGMGSEREQIHYLSRLLLPLADSYLEREEMLAARHYFENDDRFNKPEDPKKPGERSLKARYKAAFDEARKRSEENVKPKLTFEEAMFVAMRAQGGEPSEVFTTTFVAQMPTDPAQIKAVPNFDPKFDAAVKAHREALQKRLDEKFALALRGPHVAKGTSGQSGDMQKRTIARLLFGLAAPIAEDKAADDPKLKGVSPNTAKYAEALAETEAYQTEIRRVYAVCGLKTTLAAISDEIAEAHKQAGEATRAQEQDLITFVGDNDALIEELRNRYEELQTEIERKDDNTRKLTVQKGLVTQGEAKVKDLEDKLLASRKLTEADADKLTRVSAEVLKLRLEVRDAIKQTEEAEREIRRLEALIRAQERSSKN